MVTEGDPLTRLGTHQEPRWERGVGMGLPLRATEDPSAHNTAGGGGRLPGRRSPVTHAPTTRRPYQPKWFQDDWLKLKSTPQPKTKPRKHARMAI